MILYEILAGHPPFTGRSPEEILIKVLVGHPTPLGKRSIQDPTSAVPISIHPQEDMGEARAHRATAPRAGELEPRIPLELAAICSRAMARQPEQRYPDAVALARAVADWLAGEQRRQQARTVLASVQALPTEVATLRQEAAQLRQRAAASLAGMRPYEPVDAKKPGWALEDEARRKELEAGLREVAYLQGLRGSLTHDASLPEAHEQLAAYYHAEHARAEASKDVGRAAQLEILLRAHDRQGFHSAYLQGDGLLTLFTNPEGALVELYRYVLSERRLVPELIRVLGTTPLRSIPLAMGSYLLRIRKEGRGNVSYPVNIRRASAWDGVPPSGRELHPLYLPPAQAMCPDEVYIPEGWFESGGDPEGWNSLPHRRLWVDGFAMRRFPVTNREYLEFLNDLLAMGREEEALRHAPREKAGGLGEQGTLIYGRDGEGRLILRADAEGELWEPDWPVCMVDWFGARAYAAWLSQRTGLPWRLPMELEWEKAARGSDGRFLPWGDFADPTWAHMIESLPGRPSPSVVDSYPIDESPYGVRGMAGNMRDWCQDEFRPEGPRIENDCVVIETELPPQVDNDQVFRVSRGGSWNGTLRALRATVRYHSLPGIRSAVVGFRLVREISTPPDA